MRLLSKILATIFACSILFLSPASGKERKKKPYLETYVDRIMNHLRTNAPQHNSQRPDYDAAVFIWSDADILKRNIFQKYLPYLNSSRKDTDHYEAEFLGSVIFTNPNIYNQLYFPTTPNKNKFIEKHLELIVPKNLKLNVYSQYLTGNTYSPLAYKSWKYYNFTLDSLWQKEGHTYYKIHYSPKIQNYKFLDGYLITSDRNWGIREMHYSSGTLFMGYTNHVIMGEEGAPDEFLPVEINMATKAAILGNHLKGNYNARIKYQSIEESKFKRKSGKEKYNLTQPYNPQTERISNLAGYILKFRDSVTLADMPAVPEELMEEKKDTVKKANALAKVGSFFIKDNSLDLKQMGELRMYPLISPVLLNYSTRQGLSYTQKFRYKRETPDGKLFSLEPRIGYNFTFKELYWGVKGELNYLPKRMSRVFLDIGNGNRIETDRIRNQLRKLPFMVFDSTKLNLTDFRNSFARIGHKIELSNGFTLSTNLSFQRYQERNQSDLTVIYPLSLYVKRAQQIARHTYSSFVPEIELKFTPNQYYHYVGNRKEYLYSYAPTFTVNFAKAIKGVFNSTTGYNRLELDVSHKGSVGPMHTIFYRVGAGRFFNYTDFFFAEFNFLRKNNLPDGWTDDIGGAFQLLRRHQYYEMEKYLRVNLQYEAPILLVSSILKKIKYINREKLYCNLLFTNTMKPYIELGYGIGTHLFNIGLFWGGEVNRWNQVGVKFSLDIE